MVNDFFFVLYWWFLIFVLGFSFLPLTLFLFRKFFDKGYALSKIIAILLISYLTWLLGSLKIAPFLTEIIWLIIIASAAGNFFLFQKRRSEFKKEIKKYWRVFLLEEVLFFVSLLFWSLIRGFQPHILGLEKFMDYGFVNTILRSKYFPPTDMWLAGETINYYYFGHLVSAVLTKLSGLDSAITYNLMIATLFALTFTATFSLGGNFYQKAIKKQSRKTIKKIIVAGLLSALLLTLGGNLHPFYWFIKKGNFENYWYPDATRFILQKFGAADNTIHEFPLYSFVVADLHGHLINLPFVLLFLAILLTIFRQKKFSWPHYLLISLLLGVFYITNTWDFLIYSLVFGVIILLFNYLKHGFKTKTLGQTIMIGGGCLLAALLFSLPFHLHFKNIAQGVKLVDFHSPPWMLLVLWGFPLLTTIIFLSFRKKRTRTDQFLLVLLILSWILVFMPEIVYVKDIYIHSHQRANTVFKLTYQSFVIFSLISGYALVKALTEIKQKYLKLACCGLLTVACFFVLLYPYFAIRSYYGLKTYQGLYGLNYLNQKYPGDYQAVLWLKEKITGQPVIVEAVGESYTDFARVSANTGLPTVLGWRVHEWLWRGSFDEAGKRTEEVRTIYESPDLIRTKALLSQYQVELVFIGQLETRQYPQLQESKFSQLGEIVFSSGETKIYQLKN